jgi:hypothetical protein
MTLASGLFIFFISLFPISSLDWLSYLIVGVVLGVTATSSLKSSVCLFCSWGFSLFYVFDWNSALQKFPIPTLAGYILGSLFDHIFHFRYIMGNLELSSEAVERLQSRGDNELTVPWAYKWASRARSNGMCRKLVWFFIYNELKELWIKSMYVINFRINSTILNETFR